jgi:hypothetical protein
VIREHARQTAFLQGLMLCCEGEAARQLIRRLAKARHEDRVIRIAVLLAALAGGAAILIYGYAAVLVSDFFDRRSALLVFIQVLGVASLVCVAMFVPYWCWSRALFNSLHEECRCFLMKHLKGDLVIRHEEEFVTMVSKVRHGCRPRADGLRR